MIGIGKGASKRSLLAKGMLLSIGFVGLLAEEIPPERLNSSLNLIRDKLERQRDVASSM